MTSTRARTTGVAFAVLVAGVTAALLLVPARESEQHQAPMFRLDPVDPSGQAVNLADYRGKPVVLNFFASWCVPCRKEMPLFQQEQEHAGDEVVFIGIDHRDSRTQARDLLEQTGVTYPTGYDPNGSVATRYRLRSGLPTTVFIGRDGRVVGEKLGELNAAELRQWIERLTGPS